MHTSDLIFSSCSSGFIHEKNKKADQRKATVDLGSNSGAAVVPPPHQSTRHRPQLKTLMNSKWLNCLILILLLLNIVLTVVCLTRQTRRRYYRGYMQQNPTPGRGNPRFYGNHATAAYEPQYVGGY